MRLLALSLLCAAAASVVSADQTVSFAERRNIIAQTFRQRNGKLDRRQSDPVVVTAGYNADTTAAAAAKPKYLTAKTLKYWVNGKAIPEVKFDVGESYAGLLPISADPNETRKLYFWYFPAANAETPADILGADKEVLIWLNGGPGCSSLEGLFQENGPFSWQYGTYKPVKNPWSWNKLTNVLWVEQPVGTGFSQGVANAKGSADAAAQFAGFYKNFVDTFDLKSRKIYITGESYAGTYIPYIADHFLSKADKIYYDLQGTLLYDPLIGESFVQDTVPAAQYVNVWKDLFALNDTFLADIKARATKCGYTQYISKYLTYPPPKGFQPNKPASTPAGCDLWMDIFNAVLLTNPCFDVYQIATTCPLLWDNLGFPGSMEYLPEGASVYFDRADVKKAINAPNVKWSTCSAGNVFVGTPDGADLSPPPIFSVLPRVIEKSARTLISHGVLDFVLIENGTLLAIQNMTWGGLQGFQKPPVEQMLIPYHANGELGSIAGAGVLGTAHTERGLTYSSVKLTGHMVPQYAPSVGYRHVQFLLGRIPSLNKF